MRPLGDLGRGVRHLVPRRRASPSGISFVTPGQRHTGVAERSSSIESTFTPPPRPATPSAGPATLVVGIATRPSTQPQRDSPRQARPPRRHRSGLRIDPCGDVLEVHPSHAPRRTASIRLLPTSVRLKIAAAAPGAPLRSRRSRPRRLLHPALFPTSFARALLSVWLPTRSPWRVSCCLTSMHLVGERYHRDDDVSSGDSILCGVPVPTLRLWPPSR